MVGIDDIAPVKIGRYESQGMLLAASVGEEGKPVIATFAEDVPNGARFEVRPNLRITFCALIRDSKIHYNQITPTAGKITPTGNSMSRVIKTIEIEGRPVKASFDTGAFHSYVLRRYLERVPMRSVTKPYEVALGGQTIKVKERALINGKIEGLDFDTSVVPVESLGKANGHDLDAIIGAITMEAWEITVNPKDGTLGLEGLRRREFTEY